MKKIFILLFALLSVQLVDAQTTTQCYNCKGTGQILCGACGGNGGVFMPPFGYTACFACGGRGRLSCFTCGGTGYITIPTPYPTPYPIPGPTPSINDSGSSTKCSRCNGTGNCRTCKGTGRVVDWGPSSITSHEKYEQRCRVCDGSGRCGVCDGRGSH